MTLTIRDRERVAKALTDRPSYSIDERHTNLYEVARLIAKFTSEIDRAKKQEELAEKQQELIREENGREEAETCCERYKAKKSRLEKKPTNTAK